MIKFILVTFFSFSLSQAATIQSAYFNSLTQHLDMTVTYTGGFEAHHFSLEWDECKEAYGTKEIAARLIDSGWNDIGTEEFSQTVSFDLSTNSCRPAVLTIFSDRYSRATLWIE